MNDLSVSFLWGFLVHILVFVCFLLSTVFKIHYLLIITCSFCSGGLYCMPSAGNCWLDSGAVGLELACCCCPPSEAVDSTVELFWNWRVQRAVVVCLVRLSACHWLFMPSHVWYEFWISNVHCVYKVGWIVPSLLRDALKNNSSFSTSLWLIYMSVPNLCSNFCEQDKKAGLACETKIFITFKTAGFKDREGSTM